jgi:cathepsin L
MYLLIRGEAGYMKLKREAGYCGQDSHNQDGVGCSSDPVNVTVCGQCGILYDVSYPTGAGL